jgi:DNA-directed RNA polymerase specialized sigma24 family protein
MSNEDQVIMAELYEQHKQLLTTLVRSRFRRKGGDLEEMESEANLLFVKAYETFDENKRSGTGSREKDFERWLRFFVSHQLTETARKIQYRRRICPRVQFNAENDMSQYTDRHLGPSRLVELMDSLSKDAKQVARIVLKSPWFVFTDLPASKPRTTLRRLLERFKWSQKRIDAAFDELDAIVGEM